MTTSGKLGLDQNTQHHENPAVIRLDQKISGNSALMHTNIHFPLELHTQLRMHAAIGETTLRELIRTVLEQWIRTHGMDLDKISRGEVIIPAEPDGRANPGQGGANQTYGVFVAHDVYLRIKEISELMGLTMRGIIVGIMKEWTKEHCA